MNRLDGQPDGRSQRATRTREAIIASCRKLMALGAAQPPMVAVVREAGVSGRSGFQHFEGIEALWRAALQDPGVGTALLAHKFGDELPGLSLVARDRALRAIVFGF